MFIRVLLLLFSITTLLLAEPSLAQVKQAVTQNPALLNTPQAKALMQEKGVSASEVKQKLAESKSSVKESSSEATVDNNIDTTVDEDSTISTESTEDLKKQGSVAKRVNPFAYKSNARVRAELNAKQQRTLGSKLQRYSVSFYANKNKLDSSSLPTPDDYIMSVGDRIGIHVYGDRDTKYSSKIKNDGTIDLAFIGPLKIGGMEFAEAKKHLMQQLKNHFKMSDFNINIDKYSTIQVTLVGDVKYPGLYNLSSFSTVKDLLIVAKGVRKSASVRNIIVKRNSKVIAKLDFYDLLFKGKKFATILLKHGDIILINKAKKLVNIDGYVNHAAQFELKGNENLQKLIEYAGGLKPDASKAEIKVNRFDDNAKLKTYKVSYKDSQKFQMKDGDSVYIYPLDFTAKNSINVYGNIIRPGTYSLNKIKTLNEFFKRELTSGIKKFFLPNTYFEYGVIQRYNNNLQNESQSFNLTNVINGTETVKLNPNDKVYIFGLNDIYSNSYVLTKGSSLIRPGKLQYVAGMTIEDAINAAGIDGVLDDKVRVTTYATEDYMPQTSFYSLKTAGNTVLNPYDEVEVYDYYGTHILEPVTIKGEVVKPTSVYYEKGMSVADLLNIAGGFNKTAYTKSLSILRYYVDKTQTRQQKVINIDLNGTTLSAIKLEPYDEVRVSKILGWDAQDYETASIVGEVHKPKTVKYGAGLTLKDLVIMAGGLTKRAYNRNVEIVRYRVDENETRQREILKIDTENRAFSSIVLEPYDEVRIFKIPQWSEKRTVELRGEVKFPGSYSIENGEKLSSVIKRAGGFTKEAFVDGAVFTRENIRKNQIKQYNDTLSKVKRELALYNAMPANSKQGASAQDGSSLSAIDDIMKEAKKYQPIGRISIVLDDNLTLFDNSEYNIVLKDKDTLTIPSQMDTITVFGEVFNPTSFVYNSEKSVDEYIKMASGVSRTADENNIYIIHANGTSEPISSSWFGNIDIQKGDTIVVPIYIKENNILDVWNSVAKIFSSFALTAAAVNSLGVL